MTYRDGVIFAIVFALIVLDFISGVVAAFANGEWKSNVMRQGLLHKCSLLLCMALGAILNYAQNYLALGIEVPAFESISVYIALMESGSVIENVCKSNEELLPEKLRAIFGIKGDRKDGENDGRNDG